ncbi:hypothetical protein SAMN06297251_10591 [Fulvimarina manganoxydans]|uniref:DUF5330 domain-containing protein n=1 Tax=Fulvimarina manganoxydans TaxID=937218 RepID=A0A1W2AUF0_9HYPH|nr:DUF5330 domain-containing protein [Fulvimarina manganoxydans]SMC64347.1 hypothetical protein SAMN06297251_10591 [Fulvimarina manganoxydans]
MIRFLLKTAFLVGLGSLLIPGFGPSDDAAPEIDLWQSAAGIQAAVSDVLSFCDRAPAACETGGELAGFVRSRIETGLTIAYDLAISSEPGPGAVPAIGVPALGASSPAPRPQAATTAPSGHGLPETMSPGLVEALARLNALDPETLLDRGAGAADITGSLTPDQQSMARKVLEAALAARQTATPASDQSAPPASIPPRRLDEAELSGEAPLPANGPLPQARPPL